MGFFIDDENEVVKQETKQSAFIPARPMDAQAPTSSHASAIFKLSVLLIPLFIYGGYHWYQNTEARTTINKTITTNDDLENGLVGHWTFDGPDMNWGSSTAEVLDNSGQGNHGDATNFNQSNAHAGKVGQAMGFDGVNDSIAIPDDSTLQPGNGSWTISGWFQVPNRDQVSPLITKRQNGGEFEMFGIFITDNNGATIEGKRLVVHFRESGSVTRVSLSDNYLSLGDWHQYTAVANKAMDQVQLYVDGSPIAYSTSNLGSWPTVDNTDPLIIMNNGATTYATGTADDVRIYNRALSASEVKRLYEMGATTHINTTIDINDDLENGLVVHYTFDGPDMDIGSGTQEVHDRSTYGNHGNWRNHATTTVSGRIGQALMFDGSDDRVTSTFPPPTSLNDLSPITVSAWIKPQSAGEGNLAHIAAKEGVIIAGSWQFFLITSNNCRASAPVSTDSIGFSRYGSGTVLQTVRCAVDYSIDYNVWQHVLVTWDGSSGENATSGVRIYRDGEELSYASTWYGATPGSFVSDSSYTLYIGNRSSTDRTFNGAIDDVRIYNRALSASEVKRLYEMGATTHINTTIDTNDDLENGLVGHWTFDGPKMAWASTTAEVLDSSTSSIEGDLTNMDQSNATAGKIGQGLSFNGSTNYIRISHQSGLKSNSQAVGFWVFPSQLPSVGFDGIFSIFSGSDTDAFECFIENNSSTLACGSYPWSYTYTLPSANTWHHVYFESVSGSGKLYVNGSLVDSTGSVSYGGSANTSPIEIGTRSFQGYYFPGKIDDVRLYNRALSASEVKRLYELGGGH